MSRNIKMNYAVKKAIKEITQLTCYVLISNLLIAPIVLANDVQLTTEILTCSKITDNESRLMCFDALSSHNNLMVGVAKSAVVEQATLNSVQQVDDFAKEHVKKTSKELEQEVDSITLTISQLNKTLRGKWKITFENGQKWQQNDSGTLSLKQGDEVTLTKGAFSSVFLQKADTNRRIKVKRLK